MYWPGKSMNNLLSYCGLVDPRISASDNDLPVQPFVLPLTLTKDKVDKDPYLLPYQNFNFLS